MSKSNKKRSAATLSSSPSSSSVSISNTITSLLDCYNFLSPNEYSEKTFGLVAFLLRKSVGDINFSDLIDEAEKLNQKGQKIDFITLLQEKRQSLPDNEVSIEKCLMLTRLITYIKENKAYFDSILSDIRLDMKMKMVDNQINSDIQYPNDFRQREIDFSKRKKAQDIRRLFYCNHNELQQPPNLLYLQNRTTEHLSYLIDCKLRYDQKFRDIGLQELRKIFSNSFMIISHPHAGVNPVIISEKKHPGEYTAKVSVIIISLLHDFMQTHPNLIELYDIELSLWPLSPDYKLEESQTLTWNTCQLQGCPGDKPRIIQYAELSAITIQTNARIHFSEPLHSLKFAIKVHLNLPEHRISELYQIPLESLTFGIVTHNSHIPHMLARVMINDIGRYLKLPSIDVGIIFDFIQRYFIHRTGVEPNEFLKSYLKDELNKALNERKNPRTLEDIFMDFLVPFIHQVEFMAKHPILAMFYADRLFLGTCNSVKSAEIMMKSSNDDSPIVGLRFNSIKTNYNKSISSLTNSSKTMKNPSCAIRVDIYNNSTKKLQYRTFDTSKLINDISKFISTASTDNANYIRILSNFDDKLNVKIYKHFTEFNKYYDDRLHEIYKTDEKYKPLTNLIYNIEDEDIDDNNNNNHNQNLDLPDILLDNPHSVPPPHISTVNHEYNSIIPNIHSPSNQQSFSHVNNQDLIQYILCQPQLLNELLHRINNLNLSTSTEQQQSYQSQLQMSYQNQPILYPYQQQLMSTPFQIQPQGHQQLPQIQFPQQQQQQLFNQQRASPITISNQYQQSQMFPVNNIQNFSQQNLTQFDTFQMSQNDILQSIIDPPQFTTVDELSSIPINQDIENVWDNLLPS